MLIEPSNHARRRIGFYPGPLEVRMEEEAYTPGPAPNRVLPPEVAESAFATACDEGRWILKLFENRPAEDKLQHLSSEEKFRLLEDNRKLITLLTGGETTKFSTEWVIYSILIFSSFVIITLACLTAFANLPKEVTITFVGTAVGGTLATIAQNSQRLGGEVASPLYRQIFPDGPYSRQICAKQL